MRTRKIIVPMMVFVFLAAQHALASPPRWESLPALDDTVSTLFSSDYDGTPRLYVGGEFTQAGVIPVSHAAAWDGVGWSSLGSELNGEVLSFEIFDAGAGPQLYVSGVFFITPSVGFVNSIARLENGAWALFAPQAGMSWIGHLVSFDDGAGARLYVSGGFSSSAGSYISRWSPTGWSTVGGGLTSVVHDSVIFDDGDGRGLYVTGSFPTAGPHDVHFVARWDGAWSGLNGGLRDGPGYAITVFDDGRGPAVYVGGQFSRVGAANLTAHNIARWDGANWEALGDGVNGTIKSLAVFDDGYGPKLYVGGSFSQAGLASANKIAAWDGQQWTSVAGGVTGTSAVVDALEAHDPDGAGPKRASLFVGGKFSMAGSTSAGNIARLVAACPADLNNDEVVDIADLAQLLAHFGTGSGATPNEGDLDLDGDVDISDLSATLAAFGGGC